MVVRRSAHRCMYEMDLMNALGFTSSGSQVVYVMHLVLADRCNTFTIYYGSLAREFLSNVVRGEVLL